MDSRSVKTAADARALVEARGLSHVKIGVVDLDGVIRGKYLARDKFFNALEAGFNFCDVIFGWDSQDQLYDKSTFTGWHTAFPDAAARIDPTSCRDVPMEGDMLFFLGEFEGTAAELCPRRLLRRIVDRQITAEEAVKAYHDALRTLGIRPLRELRADMQLTGTMMRYR